MVVVLSNLKSIPCSEEEVGSVVQYYNITKKNNIFKRPV